MPEKLERCVKKVMKTGKSESSAYAICKAQMKKEEMDMNDTIMQLVEEGHTLESARTISQALKRYNKNLPVREKEEEVKEEKKKDEKEVLEYLENQDIMITESQGFDVLENKDESDKLVVEFTAVEAGVSGNGRRYFTKDVESQKLEGLKMFMDHRYEADNVVGKIIESKMANTRRRDAKAWIKNSSRYPDLIEMVRDGRIDSVSIGGKGDIKKVKEKDNVVEEVHNLQIKEISFVGIGGIDRAKVKSIGG